MKEQKESTRMLDEVIQGMRSDQKRLPSKYFYDRKGSELFEQITHLEEYYPTRTEILILKENIDSFHRYLGDHILLIEPGSGSSKKTRILLERLDGIDTYVPIDISGPYLFNVAEELQEDFPDIRIRPLAADYIHPFELPDDLPDARPIVFFPGSTIGNFDTETVREFLSVVHNLLNGEGGFLIGVDLKKDPSILIPAYDDAKGVTAEFNKNILRHINRETGADFDPDRFDHRSVWNEEKGRVEMHLLSREDQEVRLNGETFRIRKGESIHTENSHKYTREEFAEMVSPWFEVVKVWTDPDELFSIQFLQPH